PSWAEARHPQRETLPGHPHAGGRGAQLGRADAGVSADRLGGAPGAGGLESRRRLRIQAQPDAPEQPRELGYRGGAWGGGGDARAVGQPRDGDLRRRRAHLLRHLLDGSENGEAAVVHVGLLDAGGPWGLGQLGPRAVLPGQETAGERRVRNDPDPLLDAERLQLALVLVAGEEVVLGLDRLGADEAALVALPEGAREPPGVVVGGADVAHLALAHQVVEGAERLRERRLAIVPVRLVEIDVVRLQPAQRGLHTLDDVLTRQAG